MDLRNISITFDPDYPDKVEIGMLEDGVLVEGGQFDLEEFIKLVTDYYNEKY